MTNQTRPRMWAGAILTIVLAMTAGLSTAQIPKEFTNLQVLDKDVEFGELVGTMRQFAGALGVRCNHCHVGENADTLEGFDWASDEKREKVAAREMMRMTMGINEDIIPKVAAAADDMVRVQCVTCHRGQARPQLIAEVLEGEHEASGVDGVLTRYDELKDEYYGSHTYDFSESVLTSMAETLARSGGLDDAARLLEFNIEQFPEYAPSYMLFGQLLMQQGDAAAARAKMEKAIELEPDNEWAKRMLERMSGADE